MENLSLSLREFLLVEYPRILSHPREECRYAYGYILRFLRISPEKVDNVNL